MITNSDNRIDEVNAYEEADPDADRDVELETNGQNDPEESTRAEDVEE